MDLDFKDDFERNEQRREQGLVRCDDADCPARDNPQTLDEYITAYQHWRHHGYLSGCSHGS